MTTPSDEGTRIKRPVRWEADNAERHRKLQSVGLASADEPPPGGLHDATGEWIYSQGMPEAEAREMVACLNLAPRAMELLALVRADALDNIGFPLRTKIDALLAEWDKETGDGAIKRIAQLTTERDALQARLDALTQERETLRHQLRTVREDLAAEQARTEARATLAQLYADETRDLKERIATLERELASYHAREDAALESLQAQHDAEVAEVRRERDALRENLRLLEEAVSDTRRETKCPENLSLTLWFEQQARELEKTGAASEEFANLYSEAHTARGEGDTEK